MKRTERTIEEILNIKTGSVYTSDYFLSFSEEQRIKLRYKLDRDYQKGIPKLVCAICQQPIKLRAVGSYKITDHFAHMKDSDDCPRKTNTDYDEAEWKRIIYNGTKESEKHKEMKRILEEILTKDNRFANTEPEKVIKNIKEKAEWKKPDIQSSFNGKKVVFEMQISHTFLSEIVARDIFYENNEIPLYWIFDKFDTNKPRIFQKDIYYNNNCNLFVLDDSAYDYSIKHSCLTFHVFWIEPKLDKDNKINYIWDDKLVDFNEIKFNKKRGLYYFDYYEAKTKLYTPKKEEVFNIFRNTDISNDEQKYITQFKDKINEMNVFDNINFPKWEDKEDIKRLFLIFRIFTCIKDNKIYGYGYKNMIELSNVFYNKEWMKEYNWLLLEYIENGCYDYMKKGIIYENLKNQENDLLKSDKYTKYLHWFFPEIKW